MPSTFTTHVALSDTDVATILAALGADHELSKRLASWIGDQSGDEAERFRGLAHDQWHQDGEVEVDPNAVVSFGADSGAYVLAWVWVDDPDHKDEDTDEETDDDAVFSAEDDAEMARLQPRPKLPEHCYTVQPYDKRWVISIKRGVPGYTDLTKHATPEEASAEAKRANIALGITPAQVEAMTIGSAFGWDVPGADPDRYSNITEFP